jgi:integrase
MSHEYRAPRSGNSSQRVSKKGKARWSKAAAPTEAHLGYPNATSNRWADTKPALFNLAIDSKLRGCDLVGIMVEDVAPRGYVVNRATIRQRATIRPVRFEITEQTRQAVEDLLAASQSVPSNHLFRGQRQDSHLTTRQYARLLTEWLAMIGLDPSLFGTHSLRRTKATLIYRRTGNLRAVQLLSRRQVAAPETGSPSSSCTR